MEMQKLNVLVAKERTEEVTHIIARMPVRFGWYISSIVLLLFLLLSLFGVLIKYPDVIIAEITVSTNAAPLKLVSNSSGRLRLNNLRSLDGIKENDIIAYIDNVAALKDVLFTDSLLRLYNPTQDNITDILGRFIPNAVMGELNTKYYTFINSLQEFKNYKQDSLFIKQEAGLRRTIEAQTKAVGLNDLKMNLAGNSLKFTHKFYTRDSTLLSKKVLSEADFDKTELNYLSGKSGYQDAVNNVVNTGLEVQQTQNKLQEISIQKSETEKNLRLAVLSSYNDLRDNIKSWEHQYLFRAPFDGKVEFAKFWRNNQYVQNGEAVFTIIPQQAKPIGQVLLPVQGAGKVKVGQEVIVKMEDYPFLEYGSVKGIVKSISLTTNTQKTDKGDIETYQVLVDFPQQLKTNYGGMLNFKLQGKGTVEIITNDRQLVQRLFDNMNYVLRK